MKRFVRDEESEPIIIFSPDHRSRSEAGDWYGEHAGKWLRAASLAAERTGDADLARSVDLVSSYLVLQQEQDGYLGTYRSGSACRFTSPEASSVRTWDLWTHAWMMLGLLSTGRIQAAQRIGELILRTFPAIHPSVLDLGNHAGLSSLVVLQPLAELAAVTGDERYIRFCFNALEQAEKRGLALLSAEEDVSQIGTGKIYQILWVLGGMLSLHRATGNANLLKSVEAHWQSVSRHHLTPLGGPWGGVGTHKEVFNASGFFSPAGMVETCSATTWLILSRELFLLTAKPVYIEAVERTLLNTILGAVDPNGMDWCYFTFPNGRRNNTYHWACCKSSGALALEEAASAAVTPFQDGVSINMFESCKAEILVDGTPVTIDLDSKRLAVRSAKPVWMPIYIRQPGWGKVHVEGSVPTSDGFLKIEREWYDECVTLSIEQPVTVHPLTDTVDHHGQEIVRDDYLFVSKGPFVLASELIDGYKRSETLRWPRLNPESVLRETSSGIEIQLAAREPIPLHPYHRLTGWRSTWFQVAWQ